MFKWKKAPKKLLLNFSKKITAWISNHTYPELLFVFLCIVMFSQFVKSLLCFLYLSLQDWNYANFEGWKMFVLINLAFAELVHLTCWDFHFGAEETFSKEARVRRASSGVVEECERECDHARLWLAPHQAQPGHKQSNKQTKNKIDKHKNQTFDSSAIASGKSLIMFNSLMSIIFKGIKL